MCVILQGHSWTRTAGSQVSLHKGMGWGLIGGLSATMVMDLILMVVFWAAGIPPFSCFSLVGDTLARLFSLQGIPVAGGVLMGVAAHYLIGPVLGVSYGAAVSYVRALHAGSWKKITVCAILYAEILSQPMLALTPILLHMTASEILAWYGGSLVMHLVWGYVLGMVCSTGLRQIQNRENAP